MRPAEIDEPPMDRIDELLIDDVLWGLDVDERAELERLAAEDPIDARRRATFEVTAAATALQLHFDSGLDQPPEAVKQRLEGLAIQTLAQHRGLRLADFARLTGGEHARAERGAEGATEQDSDTDSDDEDGGAIPTDPGPGPRPWFSQLLAAAAIIVAAFLFWTLQNQQDLTSRLVANSEELVQELESARDKLALDWTQDGLEGEVVWSSELQRGVMKFEGLAKNDPRAQRYQLWIIDAGREEPQPVDAGLFDVDEDGRVVIPFTPKLPVLDAQAFAVTVEQPEGVVVSKQEEVVAVASR